MGLGFTIHPAASVADNELHVASGRDYYPAIHIGFAQVHVRSGNRQPAARCHRVPRVGGKIHDYLLELAGIGLYIAQFGGYLEI